MAAKPTRRLPWLQRTLLGLFSVACALLAIQIAGPNLTFDQGVDLSFHFSGVLSFVLSLVAVFMLAALSWFLWHMAETRIDVVREAEDEAFRQARRTEPSIEAIRALSPDRKSNADS